MPKHKITILQPPARVARDAIGAPMQSAGETPDQGSAPLVGCGDGLGADAPMSLERKCLVLVAAACIMVIIVGAVGIGFAIHPVAGLLALMLCAAWIGSAIAEVLKKKRDDSSPND